MYSLRRVLTVRFSLTMFVALGLIALWAVAGVRQVLKRQIDKALEGTLTLYNARLAGGGSVCCTIQHGEFTGSFTSGSPVAILRNSSGALVQSPPPGLNDFPIDTVAFRAAVNGRTTWTTEGWREAGLRAVYAPSPAGSPPGTAVIEVATSLQPLTEANGDLLLAMIGTVLLGTMAVGFGAFWLSGSAVAPVVEVASQARLFSPDSDTTRITAHSDITEYRSLIEVLNELLDRCDHAFNAQRRLTADLGHELRSPLTALRGEMEVALRSERTPAAYQAVLRSGLEEIGRLTEMCDSLLLITQANSHTLVLDRSPTDVNDLLLRAVERVRSELELKGIIVTSRLEYVDESPLLDAELTAKMLDELIENAVNHSPEQGAVVVGTAGDDSRVLMWVQDSGAGIAPEHLPHLFDAFFRADEARTRSTQTGLGLTMAASIARAQGGSITASNLPQGGARFEVRLPSAPITVAANARGAAAA